MKKIVIAGSGGCAKVVKWLIERINAVKQEWEVLGFIDCDKEAENVIGDDDFVCNYNDELYVAIAVGLSQLRKSIFDKYKQNLNLRKLKFTLAKYIIRYRLTYRIMNCLFPKDVPCSYSVFRRNWNQLHVADLYRPASIG